MGAKPSLLREYVPQLRRMNCEVVKVESSVKLKQVSCKNLRLQRKKVHTQSEEAGVLFHQRVIDSCSFGSHKSDRS